MPKYVNAEELMKKVNCKRNCNECDFFTDGDTWCDGKTYGTTIMQMPTIDIVFCKDCKYCHAGYCEKSDDLIPHGNTEREWENWFCADGKGG